MRTTDVLVVGAGPTGLALACGLLSQGVSVRVVDRAAGPATTSRANFLHARGSEVLSRLGALGTLPSEALRATTITTYVGDRPVARLRFGDVGMRTAAPPMLISQARVEAALRARLATLGGRPEWATPLLDASQDADGVTAVVGDGQPVRAGWLVGCDGTTSTTRGLSGIGFPGARVSERFLLADVHLDWDLDRTGTTGWVHPDGMVGAMPMPMPMPMSEPGGPDDLWRILAYDPGDHDGKPTERQILDRVHEILSERTGHPTGPLRDATWASAFSVHRRLADSYRRGRMLLAGDAAHAHAPFGGQGMLTGIGDAENLAWKLALVVSGQARESLLDTYQSERRPLAAKVLRSSTATTRVNIASGPVGRFLRDRMVVPLLNVSAIQRWATYSTSQLWVSYRRGPLADSGQRGGLPRGWPRRRPQAGDRIADLACLRADGTPSRLHAELGARWALLIPAGAADGCLATARRWLGERVTPLRRATGSPADMGGLDDVELDDVGLDDVVLVRPDAHVAWRGEAGSAGLERWLQNALVGKERPTR